MLRSYADILERLGVPKWWDDQGAPRYCDFHPEHCGVYDVYVAFLTIQCQLPACGRRFDVASSIRAIPMVPEGEIVWPTDDDAGSFHYGDPPPHGCIGDTMNCETVKVLAVWENRDPRVGWKLRT